MRDKLIIYLHAQELNNPTWATSSYQHHGEVETLAQAALDREVILVVPPEDVLLLTAKLPKMHYSRLLQALPFALEEQLIAPVEDLHFVAGEYQPDGSLPVAVVSHAKMQEWLALLAAWHIQADVIIPLTLVIPFEASCWHILLEDMAVVRTGPYSGFACDKNNFEKMFDLAWTTQPPLTKTIYLYHDTNCSYAEALKKYGEINEQHLPKDQWIKSVATNNFTPSALNLLQGNYAIKKSVFPSLKLGWKVVSYLAVTWIVLLFLYPSISYFILNHRVKNMNDQIAVIYKYHFPNASSMVAPKLRLQEKIQNLSAEMSENQLLKLIGFVGKATLKTPGVKLKQVNFQNGQLAVELTAASSENFSAFADSLAQQGLSVRQQNATLVGGRINASLQIAG